MRRMLWLALGAVVIAVLAVVGLAGRSTPAAGRAAPALPRETLAGSRETIAGMLGGSGGRPFAVVFWASWCEPCRHEARAVESFASSPAGRGRVVAVNWSDVPGEARNFIRTYGWSFPVLRDANGSVGNRYQLTNLPTTFVVDGHGRIRQTLRGPQTAATLSRALAAVEGHPAA